MTSTPPATAAVALLPHQLGHTEKMIAILDKNPFAFDFSMLGSGKTYTTSYIAGKLGFNHVIVVCPLSVASKWSMMKREHNVPVESIISYCSLRSTKNHQPKHGLLKREDIKITTFVVNKETLLEEPIENESVKFTVTPKLEKLVANKTLLVFDEIQNIKNMSAQFEAARTLVECIMSPMGVGSESRCIFLSGSPIDKEDQCIRLFRAIGVFTERELAKFNPATADMEYTGLKQIYKYCSKVNPVNAALVLRPKKFSSGKVFHRYVYELFQEVVRPAFASAMKLPPIMVTLSKYNGMFDIQNEEDEKALKRAVGDLADATGYDEASGTASFVKTGANGASFAKITMCLTAIEYAKINTFVRLSKAALEDAGVGAKVILCVNYSETIKKLEKELEVYEPLLLQGSTTMKQRENILMAFQAPNDRYRVLIGNIAVMSSGIDLDDKYGSFPRVAYVNPNYSTIGLYQLTHRFVRTDSKSPASVYFVYGAKSPELRVLNALSRKSTVMKETTPEQVESGVVFLADMPYHYETALPPAFVPSVSVYSAAPAPASTVIPAANGGAGATAHDNSNYVTASNWNNFVAQPANGGAGAPAAYDDFNYVTAPLGGMAMENNVKKKLAGPVPKTATTIIEDYDATTNSCGICGDIMLHAAVIKINVCGHEFHKPCVEKWFKINTNCPECRAECKYIAPPPVLTKHQQEKAALLKGGKSLAQRMKDLQVSALSAFMDY